MSARHIAFTLILLAVLVPIILGCTDDTPPPTDESATVRPEQPASPPASATNDSDTSPAASGGAPAEADAPTALESLPNGLDPNAIPRDPAMVIVLHPARLVENPVMQRFVADGHFAALPLGKIVPAPPEEIESILLGVTALESPAPQYAFIPSISGLIETEGPLSAERVLQHVFEQSAPQSPLQAEGADRRIPVTETILGERTCFAPAPGQVTPIRLMTCQWDDNRVLIAAPSVLERMLTEPPRPSALMTAAGALPIDQDLTVAFSFDFPDSEPLLAPLLNQMRQLGPPQAGEFLDATDLIRSAALTIDLTGSTLARLDIHPRDASDAAHLEGLGKKAIGMAQAMVALATQASAGDPASALSLTGLQLASEAAQGLTSTTEDQTVSLLLRRPASFDTAVPTLLATVGAQWQKQQAVQEQFQKMQRLAMATIQYTRQEGQLPPAATVDSDGTPLLSWRVALLPFLGDEAKALYERFHLEEPWDSEHNQTLLEEMPLVYAAALPRPEPSPPSPGLTRIQAFVGANTPLGAAESPSLDYVRDNLLDKILCVQTGPDVAVPWTQPADIAYDPQTPLGGTGDLENDELPAVSFSGVTLMLQRNLDAITYEYLFTTRPLESLVEQSDAQGGAPVDPAGPVSPVEDDASEVQSGVIEVEPSSDNAPSSDAEPQPAASSAPPE